MKHLLILCIFFSSPVFAQSAKVKKGKVSVNEVVQFVFKTQQDEIIKEINKGLRQKKTNKGQFFLGEVEQIDKALGHAKMQNLPEVSAIENGFQFEIQKNVVTVEVRDILLGLVYVNGIKINISKKMSYKSLLKKVTRALEKSEQRNSFHPMDLFMDKAHALGLLAVAGLAAVAGGVIVYGIDSMFSKVGHALNADNKKAIRDFEDKLSKLDGSCHADLESLKDSGGIEDQNSAVKAVVALGDAIDEIESKLDEDDDDKLIYCKELAKKSDIDFESSIFKIDYNELIKKGCDSMEKVHECLIATKKYMDENDVEVNDSRNNYRKDDGFIPYVDAIKSAVGK